MLYRNRKFVSVLASLTLVLFLVMTSCAPSPGLSPEPSPPVTPEPSPPITPEPSPVAPILTELGLVAEPLTEKRLDVELVYSGGDETGLCYLGSYAMLAKFSDSDITFTDVVANSGIGASALYIPQVNLFMDGSFLRSIGLAARNQGFDYYIAALKGATITDDFLAPDLPMEAKQVFWVESEDEAFKLLKRLISSDIPVEVHLDTFPIKEPLSTYTSYWKGVFEFEGSRHVDHYMTVTGYDERFVYLNDPTEKVGGKGKDIPVDISDFLEAWKNGNHPTFDEGSRIGPYWMLFLGERGTVKSANELISWNRDFAVKAPGEIRKAASNPNISWLLHCNQMYRARQEFGTFLKQNGYEEAGNMFIEASELFRGLCQSQNQQADLLEIADLQEQALAEW
ncbi:MAG: hypothetical protein ISS51_01770 [Dehalococcoidales bacterium]|nr:hypothetical protein [Dehalococcoidales bacterium]